MVKTVSKDIKEAKKVTHQNQRVTGREGRVDVVAFYDPADDSTLLLAYAKLPTGATRLVRLGNDWFRPSRGTAVPAEVLAL